MQRSRRRDGGRNGTRSFARRGAGGARQDFMLCRSSLRADCTAMRDLKSPRQTQDANCVRYVRTAAPSQFTKRAIGAPTSGLRFSWPPKSALAGTPCRSTGRGGARPRRPPALARSWVGWRLRRLRGAEKVPCERPNLKARRSLQGQPSRPRAQRASSTLSAWLFERSSRRVCVVSSAPGREGEHRRGSRPADGAPPTKPQTPAHLRPRADGRMCAATENRRAHHAPIPVAGSVLQEAVRRQRRGAQRIWLRRSSSTSSAPAPPCGAVA